MEGYRVPVKLAHVNIAGTRTAEKAKRCFALVLGEPVLSVARMSGGTGE
jgi:hypothetical protein